MINQVKDLPDHVLGYEVVGHVTGEDYEQVMIPAINEKLEGYLRIGFLYHIGRGFEKFEPKAMLDDAMVGIRHPRAWERIAVVSDVEWIKKSVSLFRFAIAGEIRIYGNAEFESAKEWISKTPVLKKRKGAFRKSIRDH